MGCGRAHGNILLVDKRNDASTFTSDKLLLNAAGEFAIGGPEGDNGLFSDRRPSAISILLRL